VTSHTEVELKWELDPAAHAALARLLPQELGEPRRLDQENRFYDAADGRLRRAGMNVRLRREDDGVLMTCKRRMPHRHGAHQHDEWERPVDPAIWARIDKPGLRDALPLPPHILEALGDAPLQPLGGFANARLEFHHGSELLCLDRTDFGARVDHELEIETDEPKASTERWSAKLKAWGITWRPQAKTKFARYLELRGG
jgi:uncharacterized protein YjbK